MKTPLLKFANHIKVCHVAFVKQLFIFISIYAKMKKRNKPQNPSDVHFLDCCSPVALIISPTFTRQLYSGNGRDECYWRSLLEARDFSWRGEGVESQVVFRFQCLKIQRRTRIICWQETGRDRI